ncbi:MAG: TIGR03067 domain-containing protein [Pirellulales bacterium]
MIRRIGIFVLFVSFVVGYTPCWAQPKQTVDAELERLSGHWRVLELIENGEEVPESQMSQWLPGGGTLEIVDYTIIFESPMSHVKSTRNFRIEPNAYPKKVTIQDKDTVTGTGIYKFDEGKLILCLSRDASALPTDFSAPKGSSRLLVVLSSYAPDGKATAGRTTAIAQQPPVNANPPDMTAWKASNPPPQPAPQVVPAGGVTSKILTDAEVSKMLIGTWRENDSEGSVDLVYNGDGTFQTYRYYQTLSNFQYVFVPTPISTGTWQVQNGRLITHVTASSRANMAGQTFMPSVRSISGTDLILVDNFGRVDRAIRMR